MSNSDLAKLVEMTKNNVHQWKRVFAKAGLIDNGNEVARADSTTDNRRA